MKKVNIFTLFISTLLLLAVPTVSIADSPYPDSPNADNLPWHRYDIGELVEAIYVWSEDMDFDGDLDIVATTNKHPGTQPSDIAWFENRLNEGLSWNKILIRARTDPDPIILTTGVVVADIDQDGYKDVIVGSGDFGLGTNGSVYWFKGPADPTQGGAAWEQHNVVTNKAEYVSHVYCRDYDDDGDLDIIAAGAANDFIAINPNDFTDPTATWDIVVIAQDTGVGMWLEDMNGNGTEDVLTSYYSENGNIAFFEVEYENDSFSFPRTNVDPLIDMPFDVAAADFNNDSLMDVAVSVVDKAAGLTGPRKIFWYQAQNDGSYTSHLITDTTKPADLYPGDIDGDGKTDIVTAALFDNKVVWYQNETIGDTISWQEFIVDDNISTPGDIELKDIDNDGDLDIVTCALYGNKVVWYENRINEVSAEKIGILFVGAGEGEDYGIRWLDGYYDHLFPFFPPGFFAGRPGWEGETCYTHIHFADEAEAIICGVPEGTPIDVFCQPHEEYGGYIDPEETLPVVHGMFRHSFVFGDDTFRDTCYDDGISDDPTILFTLLGSQTVNPYNTHPWGFDHLGPHVDDPSGVGIGIADFTEMGAFNLMHTHYYTFNALGYKDPYDSQVKEWYYGAAGSNNIKDKLLAAIMADPGIDPSTEVVFRHTSESFVENKDIYGQAYVYPESMETAFDELINEEAVDRIIVFSLSSGYTNLINFGPFWRDKEGNGISVIPGKTYYECILDTNDGYGPATTADRDQLLADKPWDLYKTIMQETLDVNYDRVPLSYTLDYGTSPHYDQAILAMLEYTVNKYNIPNDGTSLKVVLTTHGYAGGYLDGAECDVYFRNAPETTNRVINTITSNFSWNGKFTVVPGPVEYAQPGEGSNTDPPSPEKPFGEIISAGEQIDMAIKGTYVNELGEVVDNGLVDDETNEIYDYIVFIPNTFDAESSDTLGHARKCVLGNHEAGTVEGSINTWIRQEIDQNGLEYGDPAAVAPYYPFHDSENYTVRVMDGSGWCSEAEDTSVVCKGAAIPEATTVIISGTVLSHPDGIAREEITEAAAEVILGAIKDPDIGGYNDPPLPDSPPVITGGPARVSDALPLSTDPSAPTAVDPMGQSIVWSFEDDQGSCSEPCTHTWQYRLAGEQAWSVPQTAGNFWIWVWTEDIATVTGGGIFEFKVAVTDCANQTTESPIYYISVDQPPKITSYPARVSDALPLSTDPSAPTAVDPMGQSIVWSFEDDQGSCSEPCTHTWQYRLAGDEAWSVPQTAGNFWIWVWTEDIATVTGGGIFEFKVAVTDCANQTVESEFYYIEVN